MKTSARFLAMLLAVLMIASAAISVSAFSDVPAGAEHAVAISVLSQLNIVGGYEDGTFKPEQNVTRAEMAKLVYVLSTTFVQAGEGKGEFKDVKADNWAAGYISWCAAKNIIGGYGDGNFGPADNVTYDQALKMVAGALGYNEWDSKLWPTDVRLKALNELKLGADIPEEVKGGDKLTRAQVAQIMYNALFAPMKETKTVNNKYVDANNQEFYIPATVNKVLSRDVWDFVETTYTVEGTENYGARTNQDDEIAIQKINADGTRTYRDQGLVKTYPVITETLEDLGLTAYEGKTDNLINLYITTVTKDGEMLQSATVNGTVTDNVVAVYPESRKYVKINGVEYTAKNFNGTAKDQIDLYNIDGTPVTVTGAVAGSIFDANDKLVTAFTNLLEPKAANTVRIIDFDGDGDLDGFVVTPKEAYEVTAIKNKIVNGKAIPHISYKTLSGTIKTDIPAANVINPADGAAVSLAVKDVFVGALVGDTLYAEIVRPLEAYATTIKLSDKILEIEEVGAVKYGSDRTVAGVDTVSLTAAVLELADKQVYYVYNGEILRTTASMTDYDFVIFQNIEQVQNGSFNNVTMEDGTAYEATILVIEDGKLVEKKVTLANDVAAYVGATPYTPAQMFAALDPNGGVDGKGVANNMFAHNTDANGKREYHYMIATSCYESKKGGYVLTFDNNLDPTEYVTIPAGATFSYNPSTKIYSLGSEKIVLLDDNSLVFYKYSRPLTASGSFKYLGLYTLENITGNKFNETTIGTSFLRLNKQDGTATLLATIVDNVTGIADVIDYTNDGRLIVYAPESSTTFKKSGVLYNRYVFMDNDTLTTKAPEEALNVAYNSVTNPGATTGFLYYYDLTSGEYEVLTNSVASAYVYADGTVGLKTIKYGTLKNVIPSLNLVAYMDGLTEKNVRVDSSVKIWGLSEKDKNDSYLQMSIEDLKVMFDTVNDYNNEDANTLNDLPIDIIMTFYEDVKGDLHLASIIVEIYELPEDTNTTKPVSVNDIIFDNYKGFAD